MSLVLIHERSELESLFLTVYVAVVALSLLVCLGYLILAPDPDTERAQAIIVMGMAGGSLWPIVIVLGIFAALVLGIRYLIHGRPPERPEWELYD